jgi:hypothetical protein
VMCSVAFCRAHKLRKTPKIRQRKTYLYCGHVRMEVFSWRTTWLGEL